MARCTANVNKTKKYNFLYYPKSLNFVPPKKVGQRTKFTTFYLTDVSETKIISFECYKNDSFLFHQKRWDKDSASCLSFKKDVNALIIGKNTTSSRFKVVG